MTFNPNHNIMSFFDNARQGFPEGHEYRTSSPETKTITMTTALQDLLEWADHWGYSDLLKDKINSLMQKERETLMDLMPYAVKESRELCFENKFPTHPTNKP